MGRPFIFEFSDIDTGKFYICGMCRMPFSRSIDAHHYLTWGSEAHRNLDSMSYIGAICNILGSGDIRVIRNDHLEFYMEEIHCIRCNNHVGYKFNDIGPWITQLFYTLHTSKIWYRINGMDHDPGMVTFEDWFDKFPVPVNNPKLTSLLSFVFPSQNENEENVYDLFSLH